MSKSHCRHFGNVILTSSGLTPAALTTCRLWWKVVLLTQSMACTIRVLSWCRQFGHNAKLKQSRRVPLECLSAKEIDATLTGLLCLSQHQDFKGVRDALHHGKAVLSPPHIASLRLFLDSEGLLRIRGQLSHADVNSNLKHPVILHGQFPLIHRLVESVRQS